MAGSKLYKWLLDVGVAFIIISVLMFISAFTFGSGVTEEIDRISMSAGVICAIIGTVGVVSGIYLYFAPEE
ncbi:MAG: hypothetical protein ACXADW_13770 [Candidatus Hodarchaeales archaeon]|jgi:hypothetical protein